MSEERITPPPGRTLPKVNASSRELGGLEVSISLFPDRMNESLSAFFTETVERRRLYWLLASLARHQSVRTANAMAFDLFLALVPMLGLAGWTASLIVRSGSAEIPATAFLTGLTPAQIDEFIGRHFEAMSSAHLAPIAALAGWWLVSSAFDTMMGVFEETFDCKPRSWLETRALSLGFALLGMVLLGGGGGLGVLITIAPPAILTAAFDSLQDWGLYKLGAVVISLSITTSFFALLYRYSIRRPGKKRHVWKGAFAATFLGAAATVGLGYYAAHIARYALFYGGLAAIVIVLMWLWLWSTAILLGAEINVAMEDVKTSKLARALRQTEEPIT